jgi:hypothetical protein
LLADASLAVFRNEPCGFPERFLRFPEMFPGLPEMFPGFPERFLRFPEMFPGVPERFLRFPEGFPGVPEMFFGVPNEPADGYGRFVISCFSRIASFRIQNSKFKIQNLNKYHEKANKFSVGDFRRNHPFCRMFG